MQRTIYIIFTIGFLMLWSSCRKDFDFSPSTGNLEFSKDTVYLDTVFTNIGSSTYNLKVYNRSNNDIKIPSIRLALGNTSNYRLNVDGLTGKTFENIEILAKDSLFIFIETTIDINNLPNTDGKFLYTDQIEFDAGANLQKVELVTLVQDAVFIYPDRDSTTKVIETLSLDINGDTVETDLQGRELLPEELTFTNTKPYVIYGFAAVPSGETLTIEAGARIHFHENSGLIVSDGASLQVNGSLSADPETLENQVIFESDRLEPDFSNVSGQWGVIWLFDGSVNNSINYATIKNASIGILCDGNPNVATEKLKITNSQIYNSSSFGILGRNTSITGENVVINNSGQSSFAGTFGGKYNFTHCTIANYWNGSRQLPSVLLNNFIIDENDTAILTDLTQANFNNCIIYGNDNPEIILDEIEDAAVVFNFKFTNCLIRFDNRNGNITGANYDLNDTNHYEGNIFNQDPNFLNTSLNKLVIGEDSAAINKGLSTFATQVPFDILNVNRTAAPDLGTYQHIVFPVED
ncbi:right-handed parallel beta-helix repeat-containing protein [Mariniflexile gromovii]|uniref:Right-handed parallel beta-helix repeat-containing protein n=1 Tax=Mariniflexile gromovii TaxID=362523 RepID=A0ABS4BWN7_9FLAO|nr:right-handed parallel beta-helix repeat-containing protein [Mariniflexile gromovii]MBP0904996.1 right-handed parallel beta-helix repeat-containing protein [Mariniflexile gromovii]